MLNTAYARIGRAALRHNLRLVREMCPNSRILAVVKSDAYGHGMVPVCEALDSADGFAVARLKEALALRTAGLSKRIVLFGTLLDASDMAACSAAEIDVTVHDRATLALVARTAGRYPIRIWLKLDSGMHRIGLDARGFVEADQLLRTLSGVMEVTYMSHFSTSDHVSTKVMDQQMTTFRRCCSAGSVRNFSVANSAALIRRSGYHGDWVRPGIILYGCNPLEELYPLQLRPAMTLCSRVLAIRSIGPGESVGYGGRWTSSRFSRIATIGIGYGDGYPRHAPSGTPVLINDVTVPLVGQVSMDSLTIDVTECPSVKIGDEAVMWGAGLPVSTIAQHTNTISYELFTSVQQRVDRRYE